MLRAPLPTTLNYNLAIHSNDSFWIVQKDQASLSAVRLTTPRRPVQTGRLHSLQGRVQCELPRTNLETKSAQTIPPPDRRSMRRRRLLMGALGALMLMGVARKVMLGKTGRFVRSFASLPAPATSQPNSSGRRAQHIAAETLNALCFLNAVWRWSEDQTSTFLIAHEL